MIMKNTKEILITVLFAIGIIGILIEGVINIFNYDTHPLLLAVKHWYIVLPSVISLCVGVYLKINLK